MEQIKKHYHELVIADKVVRRSYSRVKSLFAEPNLLVVQRRAFARFFEHDLAEFIGSFFPIKSKNGGIELHFNGIIKGKPKRTETECREESKSYEVPLNIDLMIVNNVTGEAKKAKKNSSEGIFLANFPLLTDKCTFIINGIEKFVISQIVRSPGSYILTKSQLKLSSSQKKQYEGKVCELLPSRGKLMLFYIPENQDFVNIAIKSITGDSTSQFPCAQFLQAFGLKLETILALFDHNHYIAKTILQENYVFKPAEIIKNKFFNAFAREINTEGEIEAGFAIEKHLRRLVFEFNQKYSTKIDRLLRELNKLDPHSADFENVQKEFDKLLTSAKSLLELICVEWAARDIIMRLSISHRIGNEDHLASYQALLMAHFFQKQFMNIAKSGRYKLNYKLRFSERLYHRVLAQDLYSKAGELVFPKDTFIDKERLDVIKSHAVTGDLAVTRQLKLDYTGTVKHFEKVINLEEILVYTNNEKKDQVIKIIGLEPGIENESLKVADFICIISYLINLEHGIGYYDDIDHLGNKRLKLFDELIQKRINVGMLRIEKAVREKMDFLETQNKTSEYDYELNETIQSKLLTVRTLVNTKQFQLIIKDFFNSHPLIQFIDQQNPLSELTNKRRISATGPGGISREDPNLNVRNVHYSHYGRICPIESPEGMNIGLIMSLANYVDVDANGFLITPYYRVKAGVITNEIVWMNATKEFGYVIAQSEVVTDATNRILDAVVLCRHRSDVTTFKPEQIDFIDISPKQVFSVATSSIPFLENDDANRALMGANMQRQSVPLMKPYAPIVGTGTEHKIAHDSGMAYVSKMAGMVTKVDGKQIVVTDDRQVSYAHHLVKYRKSNQNTCDSQVPLVALGQQVQADQLLVDGPAMRNGELALGQNVLVAFMTWSGYNYEDSIILSERLFNEDVYTSIHIEEHKLECLRTKNGDEEITRDVPNVSEDAKRYLDEEGIIMVGAEVKEGDILVGKISPKSQVELSGEEKLLQTLFGEKTRSIKESSLKVGKGEEGIVVDVKRYSVNQKGIELDDDVLEVIKVYIIQKRKIQIGDKMAGRHGNKGIVSKIVPLADMPHLEDGTIVDVLLNPLGVPSRMTIGQVMEMHWGYAARKLVLNKLLEGMFSQQNAGYLGTLFGLMDYHAQQLYTHLLADFAQRQITDLATAQQRYGEVDLLILLKRLGLNYDDLSYKVATPVFDGLREGDLQEIMLEAGIDVVHNQGKFRLIDGRNGEYFDGLIALGIMYMVKLNHMVDDKIHMRAVGPYSKITQQPLGGKSQNGGQRFGEMEVWALEAYGAAYNLRELLTIKSDDVQGRNAAYNAIVRGHSIPTPSLPESFKLLLSQLQGLGLRVEYEKLTATSDEGLPASKKGAVVN